jgi:hypothetical protein
MDDRRFDALARMVARGTSRRSALKGLLGLGGAAITGGVVLDRGADAARRPTPTPKPVTCPGNQTAVDGVCTCPAGLSQCNPGVGPACCNDEVLPGSPGYSECCDNACCEGTCLGEELCCPTNNRPGGQPPTHQICNLEDGFECCPVEHVCCGIDGCCDTLCSEEGYCCSPEDVCPSAGDSAYFCCTGNTICCGAGTNANTCIPDSGCCGDADCTESQHCCDGACSDLECEPSTQCSDDFDCGGDAVCCVGDCCTPGQSCVTDPDNNSYCA